MVRVDEIRSNENEYVGFHIEGHAGLANAGKDIICAAISALAFNCINSIDKFTNARMNVKSNEEKGILDFVITDQEVPKDAALLLSSFFYGIQGIQEEYGEKYVKYTNKYGGDIF